MDTPTTVTCFNCNGVKTERVQGKSGQWFTVNCFVCQGSGVEEVGDEEDWDGDTGEHDSPYDYPRRAA